MTTPRRLCVERGQTKICYSIRFYSILFYSILFCQLPCGAWGDQEILFYSILLQYDYSQEVVCGAWGEQENIERSNWDCKADFIMAALGFTVGTGNLLAFPTECFKYGGGESHDHPYSCIATYADSLQAPIILEHNLLSNYVMTHQILV